MTYGVAWHALAFLLSAIASAILGGWWLGWLGRMGMLAQPNARSSHGKPTPTGGGLPVVALTLLSALAVSWPPGRDWLAFIVGATAVATVSFIDDRHTVAPGIRLAVHAGAVALCLAMLPSESRVLWNGLPLVLDRLIVGLAWVWLVNLTNFMDGIDGLIGSGTVAMGVGILALGLVLPLPAGLVTVAAVLAGSALGFLRHNWSPAAMFMGDVGSTSIGFILGWLLLRIAMAGEPMAAALLPLYFVADATFTLLRRAAAGVRFWEPHREHLYQRPVRAREDHAGIVLRILGVNILLAALAIASLWRPGLAAAMGAIAVGLLMLHLHRLAQARVGGEHTGAPGARAG
jgi:UDP-N-acetylmuramyl pentapeptide phosphotransferase/UDP-N-acetylglucosamine-1-phosphate transferase